MESSISRQQQLLLLETYLKDVNTEVTMILQSLQWDRKHLLEKSNMCACQYNSEHRVPPDKLLEHETGCWLKSQGYSEKDRLLPSPVDPDANTLVKLNADDIQEIINTASRCQTMFKKVAIGSFGCDSLGSGCSGNQPLTLERLQATYTADERLAIHNAVVSRVPSCHDLSDLALLSNMNDEGKTKPKSKMEILAELRDMKRRRTKYRVAAKSQNYSDVLRDVINTQMELYTQAQDKLSHLKKENPDDIEETQEGNKSKEESPIRRRANSSSKRYPNYNEHSSSFHKDSSRRYKEHDNRKRSREYNNDEHISLKYSKSHASDKSKSYRERDKYYRHEHARSNHSRSERRNDRHKRYPSRNREGSYEDYERRKTQREEDRGYRKKYTKTVPPPKIIKKEESDKTEYSENQSTLHTKIVPPPKIIKVEDNVKIETSESETVSSEKYDESKGKQYFEVRSSDNHKEKHNNMQYENTNKSHNSNDLIDRQIYSDGYKQDKDIKVKQENDDSYDSYSSEDETAHTEDESKELQTYNKHRSSDKYSRSYYYSDKDKMKFRHNKTHKNRERNYGSDLRRDIKLEKDIKQEPGESSEDRKGDETVASDHYHDNRRKDKSYSRSYKEKNIKHKDRYENRKGRYEHSNTKYGSYERRH